MVDKKDEITQEMQEKIAEFQMLQQRMGLFAQQKQAFQVQQIETENALKELETAKGNTYKLVGEILIEKNIDELKKELKEKKEEIDLRLKSLTEQEEKDQKKVMDLQQELTKMMK